MAALEVASAKKEELPSQRLPQEVELPSLSLPQEVAVNPFLPQAVVASSLLASQGFSTL
jgi:hypothetical protein